jgi:hypothetical protein
VRDHDSRPSLVCLIGAPAVGKTTVGAGICRLTGFKLFHGHIVADALSPFFPFGTPSLARLSDTWRRTFFEEAVGVGLNLVTTVAWRFDLPDDARTIWSWLRPYAEAGNVYCVELVAPLEARMERNRSAARWSHKNPYWVTDDYLRQTDANHRYDSGNQFPFDVPHLRLETGDLSAEAAAQRIVDTFELPVVAYDNNAPRGNSPQPAQDSPP